MSTTNSKNAFDSTVELRATNKRKVLDALFTEPDQSRFEIGRKTGLGDIEAQRRLSELINDGKVIITGTRKHFNCDVSLYSVKQQLELYPAEKKLTFKEWVKINHPEVLNEWENLNKKR